MRSPDATDELEQLVGALLEKDRAERVGSAEELVEMIDHAAERLPWTQRDSARAWAEHEGAYSREPCAGEDHATGVTIDVRDRATRAEGRRD